VLHPGCEYDPIRSLRVLKVEEGVTIDGFSTKSFFLRVLPSVSITAGIAVVTYFCIRWLSSAFP
jgi:hypothetical protein